jgi:hemerythrin-like domain-containing protein
MRYNTFNQVHKGLRALLYDTALTLQHTQFANPEESDPAIAKLKQVIRVFDQHASHEDEHVFAAIQQYEPSLVDAFEQEHVEDHALGEQMRELLVAFEQQQTAEARTEAGYAILHAFNAFMAFNLNHMAKEETIINERLWRYYSDDEIMGINQKIISKIPPQEMAFMATWMMKGMNNTEITYWLKGIQTNAPDVVFNMLFAIAEKELPANRFRQLLENLTEGAMVA